MRPPSPAELSALLLALYRESERLAPTALMDWVLGEIRARVPFDVALWEAGRVDATGLVCTRSGVVGRAAEFLRGYRKLRRYDALAKMAIESPGCAVAAELGPSVVGERVAAFALSESLANGVAVCTVDPATSIALLLVMYRGRRKRPFLPAEVRFVSAAAPHLAENRGSAEIAELLRHLRLETGDIGASGVIDRFARVHIAPPEFQRQLLLEWPDLRDRALLAVLGHLATSPSGTRYTGKHIVIRSSRMNDLSLLQARERRPADALTDRERETARIVAGGMTVKEAARSLRLSPSTVNNRVRTIFAKLGVTKQAEMAAAVRDLD